MDVFVPREVTLSEQLSLTASRFPQTPGLIHDGTNTRLTWAELDAAADALARGLLALGLRKNDNIAVWGLNLPHWIILMFAAARMGATLVTLNVCCRSEELAVLLRQADCAALCLLGGAREDYFLKVLGDLLPPLAEQRGTRNAQRPLLRHLLFLGETAPPGMTSLPELLALGAALSPKRHRELQEPIRPSDIANIQFTSGTSGVPKAVMLTHRGILNNGECIGQRQRFSHRDRVCLPVPLFHCLGCVIGVVACLCHGATIVLMDQFSPAGVLDMVQRMSCTALYGVPSMFRALLRHGAPERYDLSTLRTGVMAGAACPETLVRETMTRLHLPELTICYGMTEASPIISQTTCSDPAEKRWGSVGAALPGVEISIRSVAGNFPLPAGVMGEICCRGYSVMPGYHHMPEATARAIDAEGWLHTGDLGFLDAEGYLHVDGRIKDIIIRCGENISPREVERCLTACPGVADAQVVGRPSEVYGEEVCAFILSDTEIPAETIRGHCLQHLSPYKIPRHIAMVREFPLTASGKIKKSSLREQALTLFCAAEQSG